MQFAVPERCRLGKNGVDVDPYFGVGEALWTARD